MLHLISSIQMPMYLAHCCTSNDMEYAEVVSSEAEKHTPIHFLWHTIYRKEFHVWTCRVQRFVQLHFARLHNVIIAHSIPRVLSVDSSIWVDYSALYNYAFYNFEYLRLQKMLTADVIHIQYINILPVRVLCKCLVLTYHKHVKNLQSNNMLSISATTECEWTIVAIVLVGL